jgi:hypothetical protein
LEDWKVFEPFANDTDTLNINGDALGRQRHRSPLHFPRPGNVRDKTGLTTALALQKSAINAIVDALQNDASLPVKLAVNR